MVKRFSRRVVVGVVGVMMLVLSVAGATSVGAQVPCNAGNYSCAYAYGANGYYPGYNGYAYTQPYAYAQQPVYNYGYPRNAVISSYFDPRYCGNGAVSVVTDAGGALIDVCTSTGQRIIPIYPDFVAAPTYGYGYAPYTYGYRYR